MSKHEQYEELCVLAMIGEASASELHQLRQHLDGCADCRRDYKDFTELVLPQLSLAGDILPGFSHNPFDDEAHSMRARFLDGAQAAGISFTPKAVDAVPPPVADIQAANISHGKRATVSTNWMWRGAVAASLIAAAGIGGYYGAMERNARTSAAAGKLAGGQAQTAQTSTAPASPTKPSAIPLGTIGAGNLKELAHLNQEVKDVGLQLEQARSAVAGVESERSVLHGQIRQQQQQLATAQQQAQVSQQALADLRMKLQQSQALAESDQASFIADEVKIKDLSDKMQAQTASFEQERGMLGKGGEVSSMMTARNLHIIDVYDTDGSGRTKAAFGRIFLTENKRLVFYAYDLNESRLDSAKYAYRVWGEKQSPDGNCEGPWHLLCG